MVSALPPETVRSPEILVATPISKPVVGAAVPMPTRPDDSCTTTGEEPMVNPWPVAIVVVPLVLVNCPRPKYPVPLAVRFVVLAPPDAVKRPELIVEDAVEINPAKVERPETSSVDENVEAPEAASVPTLAACENKFVELAVVEKRLVVVPAVSESVPRVERPFTLRTPKFAVLALAVVEVAVPK